MTHPPAIGPYIIEREIARGGMGVVYLAHDERLSRTVAIKSLPADLADSPERLARFEREAKALAALNHTNIAGIHSVEEVDGARYLVLEYVDGLTLSQRLEQGPLPIDDVLDITAQIARGVEAAHEAGVIHRDLKPGNIIIRPDGVVKVVDFGLAKEIESSSSSSLDLTNLPTITMPNEPATAIGQVLGTPAFLSPEQARGKQVDRRTDIWSFGCVLFECLTGERLFGGETTTDSLAAILEREPRWDALPDRTPPRIRELLRSCLEKNPKNRLRDIGDARLEIERALSNKEWSSTSISAYTGPGRKRPWVGPSIVTAIVGVALGAGAMLLAPWGGSDRAVPVAPVLRYTIDATDGSGRFQTLKDLTISRDGKQIAYSLYDGSERDREAQRTVFIREFSALEPRVIVGAEKARELFFSPDGKRLGLHTGDAIRSVSVNGGPLTTIREERRTVTNRMYWLDNDRIIQPGVTSEKLIEVSIRDGSERTIYETNPEDGFLGIENICQLPNGNGILICGWTGHTVESYRISHMAPNGKVTRLIDDASSPFIVGDRYLVFMRRSTLFAARFDAENARLMSDPMPVVDGVKALPWGGGGQVVISPTGVLVYEHGARITTERHLVWVDPEGAVTRALDRSDAFLESLAISGDGRLAVVSTLRNKNELWRINLETGARDRVWDTGEPDNAILNRDGSGVAFSTPPIGGAVGTESRLVIVRPGSSEEPVYLDMPGCLLWPRCWTPDEKHLLFSRYNLSERNNDLMLLNLETMEVSEYLATPHNEYDAVISPDGRWLVYGSDRSGEHNLYLRSFADGATDQLITPGGAWGKPYWSADSRSVSFALNDTMMAVDFTTDPAFVVSAPRSVFRWPWADGLSNDDQVWLAPDGRFLMIEPAEWEKTPPRFVVVQNWLAELDAKFKKD